MIAATVRSKGSAKRRLIPALPTAPYEAEHRPKLGRRLPVPACVAKPVSRKVQQSNPHAGAAMAAEWDRLRKLGTWDEAFVREWADVAREARQIGEKVHLGYDFPSRGDLNFPKVIMTESSRAGQSSRATAS